MKLADDPATPLEMGMQSISLALESGCETKPIEQAIYMVLSRSEWHCPAAIAAVELLLSAEEPQVMMNAIASESHNNTAICSRGLVNLIVCMAFVRVLAGACMSCP